MFFSKRPCFGWIKKNQQKFAYFLLTVSVFGNTIQIKKAEKNQTFFKLYFNFTYQKEDFTLWINF